MSEIPNPSPSPSPAISVAPSETDFKRELEDLRAFLVKLQSGLIILTLIVGTFILIQYWRSRNELTNARQMFVAAKQKDAAIGQFLTQLLDYSRTHTDIQPLLAKYPFQVQAAPGAASPAAAPATAPKPATGAPAPAPKK